MRILWHSVHPAVKSGYGVQTALFCRALRDAGHEVMVACSYGQQGWVGEWEGITVLPLGPQPFRYGSDVLSAHVEVAKPDLVVSLLDVFAHPPEAFRGFRWVPWLPIDATPLMSRNAPLIAIAWDRLAMSRFGQEVLRGAGFPSTVVPHAFDPDVFYVERDGQAGARAEFARRLRKPIPEDAYLVIVNGANVNVPGRKNLAGTIEAWSRFTAAHKGKPNMIYFHCEPSGFFAQGLDLGEVADLYGADRTTMFSPLPYDYAFGRIPGDTLRLAYNAADLYINPSMGEGFGIPTLEAQACGCPVAVTNFSASPELCFVGELLQGVRMYVEPNAHRHFVPTEEIVRGLEWGLRLRLEGGRPDLARSAAEMAAPYGIGRVMRDHVLPWLAGVAKRIETEGAIDGAGGGR